MRLPVATAVNTTGRPDRHLPPLRVAAVAGLLAAGVICVVFLAYPVPRPCLEAIGAPADGLARFGGLQLHWMPPTGYNIARLARRLEQRGIAATLYEQPGRVVIEVPGVRDGDMSWTAATGDGRVEVHALRDNGTIGGDVLFDEANLAEVVVTSQLDSVPVVAMLFQNTPGRTRTELDARFAGHRVAVTVDRVMRWTPVFHAALDGGLMWFTLDPRDVDALAAALYGGVLPGGTLLSMTYVPPTDLAQLVWIVRAAIVICGGFAIAALVGLCLGAVAIVLRDRAPRLIRTALPGRLARFGRCS